MASFLLLFHHWNALLCAPIGFFLNLLLLWLILHSTPKDMWVHSRVLLQTCILDILLLLMMSIGGQLMLSVQSFNMIFFFDGYLIGFYQKLWGENVQDGFQLLMLLSLGLYHLDTQSISAQFLYRYLVLNRKINIGLGRYLLLLVPSFIVNLALFSIFPLFFTRIDDLSHVESEFNISNVLMDTEQRPPQLVYEKKFTNTLVWVFMLLCSEAFFYAIIIFCGHRMVRHVAAHAMTDRLKKLNRQLSRNLIILATFPLVMDLITGMIILIFGLISMSNELSSYYVQLLLSQLVYWLSVINPMISIWTFRPYREAIKSVICCKFKIGHTVTVNLT